MAVDETLLIKVLDAVRPSLQADGGDCEFVSVDDDGVVSLELTGACAGCPMSQMTLSMGIERVLKEHVPGVTAVRAV
jgi:Fe-S cluster biogenesis protein NfuA